MGAGDPVGTEVGVGVERGLPEMGVFMTDWISVDDNSRL